MMSSVTSTAPNFLIVGTGKAGTTSLHEYLGQHPQIFMSRNKEPHYFVKGYGVEKWEDYLGLFKDAANKDAVGESSTLYLYCEESPAWIKRSLGDVKIIILLRNPAKRAFSLYGWMVREGYEDAETFAEALEREPARLNDPNFRQNCPQFYPDYLYYTTGLYYEQVRRYFDIFGRDHVRVYLFEDFIKQPFSICRDVFSFLGVQTDFTPKFEVHNEGRIPASVRRQYWLRTAAERQFAWIPRKLRKNLIYGMMERNVRRGRKPEPDAEVQAALTKRYRDNITKLANLLNQDLSRWLKTAPG
jgi:hypothetical protein